VSWLSGGGGFIVVLSVLEPHSPLNWSESCILYSLHNYRIILFTVSLYVYHLLSAANIPAFN